jgi:hypothetical protein
MCQRSRQTSVERVMIRRIKYVDAPLPMEGGYSPMNDPSFQEKRWRCWPFLSATGRGNITSEYETRGAVSQSRLGKE